MITGNFRVYEKTIANGANDALSLSSIVSTEKVIKINPGATGVRLILTPNTSTAVATATDYLLANGDNEFELGRGLSRISLYNGNGGQVKVSIAVLF